jgi:Ribbon-helix-helix protein, copG family
MSKTAQTLGFSVPPAIVKEVESMARQERRTKSELFREMVRVYRRYRTERDRDELRWVKEIIAETQAEEAKNPWTLEELLAEDDRLAQYGAAQAKKLGIKPKDVNRLIHEYRRERRAEKLVHEHRKRRTA